MTPTLARHLRILERTRIMYGLRSIGVNRAGGTSTNSHHRHPIHGNEGIELKDALINAREELVNDIGAHHYAALVIADGMWILRHSYCVDSDEQPLDGAHVYGLISELPR